MTTPNLSSSSQARIYCFACFFCWDVLSLYQYLLDETALPQAKLISSEPYSDLTDWLLDEAYFPLELEDVATAEQRRLFDIAEELGDWLIMHHWATFLERTASTAYQEQPLISYEVWLEHAYLKFLEQVLCVFEQTLSTSSYEQQHARYCQNIAKLERMQRVIKMGLSSAYSLRDASKATLSSTVENLDSQAVKLGKEWKEIVNHVADNFQLPGDL